MLRLRASLLSLCLASPALAAAPVGVFYDLDDPPISSVKVLDDARLTSILDSELKNKGVTAKNLATGATGLDGLAREVKMALLMTISSKLGAESDVMVEGKGSFTPVEVMYEGTTLTYRFGAPREKLYGAGPSKEAIRQKYGIGELVDDGAAWDANMLFVVDLVLGKLSPGELTAIAGIPFHRMPKDPANKAVKGRAIAMYRQDSQFPTRVELYDAALEVDRVRFTGSVDAPVPQSAAMLMHELGHAVSRRDSRGQFEELNTSRAALEAAAKAFNDGQKKYNEDRAEYAKSRDPELKKSLEARAAATKDEVAHVKELQKKWQDVQAATRTGLQGSALEQAYLAKLPLAQGPTLYARTAGPESFAEGYRLWKLDRAAFERVAPGLPAWFDATLTPTP